MTDAIFDGNALFARAFYAVTAKPDGTPAGIIRASLCTVFSLLNVNADKLGEKVDRILFAWDGEAKRDKGRDPKPADYHTTRQLLMEYLTLLLKPAHVCLPKHEADDVVATAVAQSDADTIYVISSDKDLQQLAGERVHYYCLNSKAILSPRYIRDKWHVKRPSQVAIALAIIGDKIDCINGVKGWGPAKVKKLFEVVTPEMDLEATLYCIEDQMAEAGLSSADLEHFYADLDLTLLRSDLKGVPQPSPVNIAAPEIAEMLHLPDFMAYYRPVHRLYHARVDECGDEEEVPC